ncbi:hypothetical protein [Halorubrum saccharovorum]|uniref:hypothetical protein n=1 Tax=Halorubrum saccharovorum TaxID=2248 RepID=UPI001F1E7305|nr:hypothetical protein [Halorubrum saccharovorum]
MSRTPSTSRRRALALAAGGTLGTLAGCLGSFDPTGEDGSDGDGSDDEFTDTTDAPEPEYGHWFGGGVDYAGTVDRRGEDEVAITVAPATASGSTRRRCGSTTTRRSAGSGPATPACTTW